MDQRISFVTLAVRDVARSYAFYVDGLGWEPEMYVPGEVLMIRTGERLLLSLWDRAHFAAEVGERILDGDGVPPVALAHNVASREEVDAILSTVRGLRAPVTGPAERDWGGFTGYFADPDGYRWEIAWNPGPIGQVVLP